MFRVPWVDDGGEVQINRGFRVEMNSAHRALQGRAAVPPHACTSGMLKFLAFEQVFKNALTTLPHGRRQGRRGLRPEGQDPTARSCASASRS